ncbi:MAG: hypothetical protein D6781_14290 [Verrucomicrobia bacterium]|nr:MAG: hypothetical protein D6781_14290 [Verrucomicrobiota bacterium]
MRFLSLTWRAGIALMLMAMAGRGAAKEAAYRGSHLAHAVFDGDAAKVRKAWEKLDRGEHEKLGAEAVWHAVALGRRDLLAVLLDLGAPADFAYSGKIGAVEVALAEGRVDMARLLLERGARGVWLPGGPGLPLERAIRFGLDELVEAARQAGWNDEAPLIEEVTLAEAMRWHGMPTEPEAALRVDAESESAEWALPEATFFAPPWAADWAGERVVVICRVSEAGRTCLSHARQVEDEVLAGYCERLADGLELIPRRGKAVPLPPGAWIKLSIELQKAKRLRIKAPADCFPVLLRAVNPVSPRYLGGDARVVAQFVVGVGGRGRDIRIVQSPLGELKKPVENALRQFLFTPGLHDGELVGVRMALPFMFNVDRPAAAN